MPTFTVEQVTAARAFLGWSQHELGVASGLSFEIVRDFEHLKQSATKKKRSGNPKSVSRGRC
jgi:ribosome-binding protein aMBF1 (putative translation factor)